MVTSYTFMVFDWVKRIIDLDAAWAEHLKSGDIKPYNSLNIRAALTFTATPSPILPTGKRS